MTMQGVNHLKEISNGQSQLKKKVQNYILNMERENRALVTASSLSFRCFNGQNVKQAWYLKPFTEVGQILSSRTNLLSCHNHLV